MVMKNILDRNEILSEIQSTLERLNKNLDFNLQKLASEQTAQFIEQNMLKCKSIYGRLALLTEAIKHIQFDGLVIETGVFQGKSINHLASLIETPIYGFDSFEGLPEDWRGNFKKGAFKVSELPKVAHNVILNKGWFEDTIPEFRARHSSPISFLHIDCDLYSATKTVLNLFEDQIVNGTIIVFDEFFNYPGWKEGEYKAFLEFTKNFNISWEYLVYYTNGESAALIIRR